MRVSTYTAHGIKRISDITFDLEGRHLYLVGGRNAEGKTSALEGLLMALAGKKDFKFPTRPLRDGEQKGFVRVELVPDEGDELGPLTVELKFTRKRGGQVAESFSVTDENGVKVAKPRVLLSRLYKLGAFDPLSFERLADKDQRAALMRLVGLDLDADEATIKGIFDRRTDINREAKRLGALLDATPHVDAPAEPVSIAGLQEEREELEREVQDAADLRRSIDTANRSAVEQKERADSLSSQIDDLEKRRDRALRQAADNEDDIAKMRVNLDQCEPPDLTEIDAEIRNAGEINSRVLANANRQNLIDQVEAETVKSEDLTDQIEAIREGHAKQLEAADWPIEGLSFDADQILYEGIPFSQRSRAERTLISFEMGAAMNPDLRLFVCQDGNDLDDIRIGVLDKLLKERDYQAVVEFVTRGEEDEERCAIVIEDGREKIAD